MSHTAIATCYTRDVMRKWKGRLEKTKHITMRITDDEYRRAMRNFYKWQKQRSHWDNSRSAWLRDLMLREN